MKLLANLFENNRMWAARQRASDPGFFDRLARQQAPEHLWIGCSDSRLPPNEILGLLPGELFVHRNVGNVVVHTDFNCLSVLEYAAMVLRVKHVIVCGHYGCGGVIAAMRKSEMGLVDNWLRHVRDVYQKHADFLNSIADERLRWDKLCELNVVEQVNNVSNTTVLHSAWDAKMPVAVHGWIYSLGDGFLRDLNMCVQSPDELEGACQNALKAIYSL